MNSLMLGIDLGTTGAKAVLVDVEGAVVSTAKSDYPLHRPQEGWAEQDPQDWWEAVVSAARQVLQGIESSQVEGLALSGQMHGSVFLDSSGQVIRPPILWNDTRTTEQCETMKNTIGEARLRELVGNPVLEGFTAPKILWLRDNEPDNFERLDTLLLPKDYMVYLLTGEKGTEPSDAAGTVLYDVEKRRWSEPVLDQLGLDSSILPRVRDSTDVVGKLTQTTSDQLGLPPGTPVIAGGADNACSAVGNGVIEAGRALVSIGSSGVVLAHTDSMQVDSEGRLHSFNHAAPNSWYLMGVMLSAGLSFRWFKDTFGGPEQEVASLANIDPYNLLTKEAAQVDPGSSKLVFLPYLNGERTPHANADARGVFFGLSDAHNKGHLARSVLEGITFGLRDSFELINDLGVAIDEVRFTGGGARSDLWGQIAADILNREITRTSISEGPGFGAALLAGVGSGLYQDVSEAAAVAIQTKVLAQPDQERVKYYDRLFQIYQSLYRSLEDDFSSLVEFDT